MEAGLTNHVREIEELVSLLDLEALTAFKKKPASRKRRGPQIRSCGEDGTKFITVSQYVKWHSSR
jgi:hypothetical protein